MLLNKNLILKLAYLSENMLWYIGAIRQVFISFKYMLNDCGVPSEEVMKDLGGVNSDS